MQDKLKEGEAFFIEGELDAAERSFQQVLEIDSRNKDAFNNLGVIAFQQGDLNKAVEWFTKILAIDPLYKDAVINYCEILKSLNIFHKAIPLLERIRDRYPEDREVFNYLEKSRLEEAENYFSEILSANPKNILLINTLRSLGLLALLQIVSNCKSTTIGKKLDSMKRNVSMLHTDVLILLYLFAKAKSGNILEIGPYIGGSTIAMAWGRQDSGSGSSSTRIITIEAGGKYPTHPELPTDDILRDLKTNLRTYGAADEVEILEGRSNDDHVIKSVSEKLCNQSPVDLFCIDADGDVKRDIDLYQKMCSKDCVLVVDDYISPGAPEKELTTRRTIQELLNQRILIEYGIFGWGTWVGRFTG
ncbi:MAG: tetratricopeptide repeat protein [Thermodesulfobacteriota bacterium]